MTTRARTAEVSGQDRGSNAVTGRAGQVACRTFPPFGYKTAPGIGARPGLGLIVGQPRRNAPFLTHGDRWIPYGGIVGGTRRELNGWDSLPARRPPIDKRARITLTAPASAAPRLTCIRTFLWGRVNLGRDASCRSGTARPPRATGRLVLDLGQDQRRTRVRRIMSKCPGCVRRQ